MWPFSKKEQADAKSKHPHTLHFLLTAAFFILGYLLFGGEGPLTAILGIGLQFAQAYAAIVSGGAFNEGIAASLQQLLLALVWFIANFVLYYIIAWIIIVILQFLFRAGKKAVQKKE